MHRDLVVIGASAGGIEALKQVCASFPASLPAAVLIVVHTSARSNGMIPRILDRAGPLPAVYARNGDPVEYGRIYVAPSDHHLLVNDSFLITNRGPRENRHRPAIDPTFRSAAMSHGRRVIGVVLTGSLDDGTSGLMVVRARHGIAIVQDPKTAMFPSMPLNALRRVPDAIVAPLEEIAAVITRFVCEKLEPSAPLMHTSSHANPRPLANPGHRNHEGAEGEPDPIPQALDAETESPTGPSPFACPECGGVLWEIDQQGLLRFRCRVGHAYTASYLQSEQNYAVEAALWAALRALEESASLYERMAQRAGEDERHSTQNIFAQRATDARSNAESLRDFLLSCGEKVSESEPA